MKIVAIIFHYPTFPLQNVLILLMFSVTVEEENRCSHGVNPFRYCGQSYYVRDIPLSKFVLLYKNIFISSLSSFCNFFLSRSTWLNLLPYYYNYLHHSLVSTHSGIHTSNKRCLIFQQFGVANKLIYNSKIKVQESIQKNRLNMFHQKKHNAPNHTQLPQLGYKEQGGANTHTRGGGAGWTHIQRCGGKGEGKSLLQKLNLEIKALALNL